MQLACAPSGRKLTVVLLIYLGEWGMLATASSISERSFLHTFSAAGSMRIGISNIALTCAVLMGQGILDCSSAAMAQVQSLAPTPAPVVLWWIDDAQTVSNPAWQLCPSQRDCQRIPLNQSSKERNEIIEELSRFSLSFDDKRRPILQYRFAGGGRLPESSSQTP